METKNKVDDLRTPQLLYAANQAYLDGTTRTLAASDEVLDNISGQMGQIDGSGAHNNVLFGCTGLMLSIPVLFIALLIITFLSDLEGGGSLALISPGAKVVVRAGILVLAALTVPCLILLLTLRNIFRRHKQFEPKEARAVLQELMDDGEILTGKVFRIEPVGTHLMIEYGYRDPAGKRHNAAYHWYFYQQSNSSLEAEQFVHVLYLKEGGITVLL